MSGRGLIIAVVALAAGAVILIAVLSGGDSQEDAQAAYCASLTSLESSLQELQALEPASASQEDYEAAVSQIEGDWDQVKSDASELADITTSDLDSAWEAFTSAVDDVPDDASAEDALGAVSSAGETLATTVQGTLSGPDCSSS